MEIKAEKNVLCLEEILQSLEEINFHGSVTIHYTNGEPRRIEYKSMHDLSKNHDQPVGVT